MVFLVTSGPNENDKEEKRTRTIVVIVFNRWIMAIFFSKYRLATDLYKAVIFK